MIPTNPRDPAYPIDIIKGWTKNEQDPEGPPIPIRETKLGQDKLEAFASANMAAMMGAAIAKAPGRSISDQIPQLARDALFGAETLIWILNGGKFD